MTILIAGGTGFIGTRLAEHFTAQGHSCLILTRYSTPKAGFLPYSELSNVRDADVVVNLAGESIAGLWTAAKKRRILQSRVKVTRLLVEWMRVMETPPTVFLSASAVGIYGDRPAERLSESSPLDPHHRFRYTVCNAWETEANRARELGVRTVNLRIGNVLDASGGALAAVLPRLRWLPFLVPFGRGAHLAAIGMEDLLGLIDLCIANAELEGPINLVAPVPTSWGKVTEALGTAVGRRTFGSIPSWLLRLAFGEFSEALLDSQYVVPRVALDADYSFLDPDPIAALKRSFSALPHLRR